MSQHSGDLQIATLQVIQPQTVRDIDFLTCIAALSSASPAFAPFEAVLRARLFAAFCSDAQTLHAAHTPRLPLSCPSYGTSAFRLSANIPGRARRRAFASGEYVANSCETSVFRQPRWLSLVLFHTPGRDAKRKELTRTVPKRNPQPKGCHGPRRHL